MKMVSDIKSKIGRYFFVNDQQIDYYEEPSTLADFVYSYGITHPGCPFSFVSLSKKEIMKHISELPCSNGSLNTSGLYDLCKMIKEPILLGTTDKSYKDDLPEGIYNIVDVGTDYHSQRHGYRLDISERHVFGRCVCIN